jgi:hypothetical protein
MIKTIVVQKVNRSVFSPFKPVEVMIGFHNKDGELVASQLLSASLFDEDIREGQEVDFKQPPAPDITNMNISYVRDFKS